MPNLIALALQNAFRIVQSRAFIESEIHMLRVNRDVKDTIAQTIAGAVANRDRAVSVVNVFVAWRHLFEHQRTKLQSKIPNFAVVRLEKLDERRWWCLWHLLYFGVF